MVKFNVKMIKVWKWQRQNQCLKIKKMKGKSIKIKLTNQIKMIKTLKFNQIWLENIEKDWTILSLILMTNY